MRYFITFARYGARLHGDESGSVDRRHNLVGRPGGCRGGARITQWLKAVIVGQVNNLPPQREG